MEDNSPLKKSKKYIGNNYANFSGSNPFSSQAKMLHHLDRIYEYMNNGDTTPIFMEVNPTNRCNLKCQWCITEEARGREEIEIDPLEGFFTDFYRLGGKAITFSGGGEPTLYPHFERAVSSAKKNALDLGLMTNGIFKEKYVSLIGENFDWVRFSVDTLNSENYSKWKGVDALKVVQKNIESIVNFPVRVGVNCNVNKDFSVKEAEELVNWTKNIKADYIQFRPVLPRFFKKGEEPSLNNPVWEYLDSIKSTNPQLNLSNDKRQDVGKGYIFPFRSCEGHFFEPILDATGEIKICMYHPRDSRFTFGNIHEKSFEEIWNSEQRKKAIEFVRSLDYSKNCQMCCKLTEPNKLLDFLKHPEEQQDINFL